MRVYVFHWDDLLPDVPDSDGALCIVPLVPERPPGLLSDVPLEVPPEVSPEEPLDAGGAEGAAPGADGVAPGVEPGLDGLEGEAPGVVLVSAGGVAEGGGVDCVDGVLVVPD